MDEQTRVNQIQVRERRKRLQPPVTPDMRPDTSATLTELPQRQRGIRALFQPEQLSRNLALVGCLALVILAARSLGQAENVSVFSALQSELTASWDQDVGKLSFVSDLLPPEIRAVWNQSPAITVMAPVRGQTVHAWSVQEPYLEVATTLTDVRAAADGEVMSIAHGLNEERIIRVRHQDSTETLYGNLQSCFVEIGDTVRSGDVIASLLPGKPLVFELRMDGRSVDPSSCMNEWPE